MTVLKDCFGDLVVFVVGEVSKQIQQIFNDKVIKLTICLLDLLVDPWSKQSDQIL